MAITITVDNNRDPVTGTDGDPSSQALQDPRSRRFIRTALERGSAAGT